MNWLSQLFGFFKSFQFWITLAPWESGLRVRLGREAEPLSPGVSLRIPFLDRIFVVCTRVRPLETRVQTLTTLDGKVLAVSGVVFFAVEDMGKLYRTVLNAEMAISSTVLSRIAAIVSGSDSHSLTVDALVNSVMNDPLGVEWGLGQVSFNVTTFAYVRTYRLVGDTYIPQGTLANLNTSQV